MYMHVQGIIWSPLVGVFPPQKFQKSILGGGNLKIRFFGKLPKFHKNIWENVLKTKKTFLKRKKTFENGKNRLKMDSYVLEMKQIHFQNKFGPF